MGLGVSAGAVPGGSGGSRGGCGAGGRSLLRPVSPTQTALPCCGHRRVQNVGQKEELGLEADGCGVLHDLTVAAVGGRA